jgi:glyoxylase I family protein
MILGLDHVSLLVSDLDASLAFYQELLGLPVVERPDLGFEGAWLALGSGLTLHLLNLPNPDPVTGRPEHAGRDRHLALRVADLQLAQQGLRDAGVAFTTSRSGRSSIFLRDPDGNGIELMQAQGAL